MKTLIAIASLAIVLVLSQCSFNTTMDIGNSSEAQDQKERVTLVKEWDGEKVEKPDSVWKNELGDQDYYVLRQAGTERAFTGDLYANRESGDYACKGCGLLLFSSDTKFKSGTGWPSFYAPEGEDHVGENSDVSYGMVRTEVVCNRCEGHLGHVFADGPEPTGLRYCINSASLEFYPE